MAYYGYDCYQAQLEHALNDDFDEDQYAQQMVDACVEMVQKLYDDSDCASSGRHRGSVIGEHGNTDKERVVDITNS